MSALKSRVKVVKTSGDVEPFDPNMITSECVEAGIEFFTAAEVALEVSKQVFDGISTKEIQDVTLKVLSQKSHEAAERYRKFHSMLVRTSQNTIEPFDRKRIAASLMRETKLPKELAENVAKEVETELRKLRLDFVSAPLIREVVNVKLLEHGFEEARADYTRLGVPVYDMTHLIEKEGSAAKNPETLHKMLADNVFKEYALLKVLPLHLADAHMRGEIHIHDLHYFAIRPFSIVHDLRFFLRRGLRTGSVTTAPARSPEVAVSHAAKMLITAQTNFAGTQTLEYFNVFLAPYLRGLEYERIKRLARSLIYELSLSSQSKPVLSEIGIEYGVPEVLRDVPAIVPGNRANGAAYGSFEEEARSFARALAEVFLEGDSTGSAFPFPKVVYKLRRENANKEGYEDFMLLVHKCAANASCGAPSFLNLNAFSGEAIANGSQVIVLDEEDAHDLRSCCLHAGTLQVVSLNLPRIAYEASKSDAKFFEILDSRLNAARDVLMVKSEVLEQRMKQGWLPFLTQDAGGVPYYRLDRVSYGIGYVGLNEMTKAYIGEELHQSDEAVQLGMRVIKHIAEVLQTWVKETGLRWTLTQPPSRAVLQRLAKLDYGLLSNKAAVQRNASGEPCYTSASFVRGDAAINLKKRLQIEGTLNRSLLTRVAATQEPPEQLLALTKAGSHMRGMKNERGAAQKGEAGGNRF